MKQKLKPILIILIIGLILISLTIRFTLLSKKTFPKPIEESIFKEEEPKSEEIEEESIRKVFVDIKGAVNNPGVYEIEENKKVIDVISLAGGFNESADTSTINLAKQVKDEMVIIIYTEEEIKKAMEGEKEFKVIDNTCVCPTLKNDACITSKNTSQSEQSKENNKTDSNEEIEIININTATAEDFDKLPGIGASKAESIIKYREEHGQFKSIEELKEISGIGDSLFEKIKDYITV